MRICCYNLNAMKGNFLIISTLAFILGTGTAFGQRIMVHDPTVQGHESVEPSTATAKVYESRVLPPVRKKIVSEGCPDSLEFAGEVKGSFTRRNSDQTAIFYQMCQTGNGLGWVGLAVIENSKVVANFVQDSGWSFGIGKVADVNRNGLDEITLEFGGAMHQGQGGIGVSIIEFKNGKPVEIGWYQAAKLVDSEISTAWILTAQPGKTPVYYRQKVVAGKNNKWRRIGPNSVFRMKRLESVFEEVK